MEGGGKLESVGVKRKRSGNFSAKERGLLVELVGKYAGVIECKKTDGTTMKEKEKAWQQVAEEYNGQVEMAKEWKNLKTVRNDNGFWFMWYSRKLHRGIG